MDKSKSKLLRISECLKNRDYSNPELVSAKIISLCIIILLLFVLFLSVCRIDSIEVEGDVSIFNESDVVEASGLKVGGCLYTKPFFMIKKSVKANLPMAEKVSVSKNFFTQRVKIKVKFSDFEYFAERDGVYYGLDKDLRVTDVRASKLEFLSLGAVMITLPEFEQPVLGDKLVFTKTVDILDEDGNVVVKGVDKSKFHYAENFLNFIADKGYEDRVDAVFLDEKFNIRTVVDGKYLVYVGRCEGLETKFEVMDEIIKEGSTDIGKYAVIYVEDPAVASARVDNTLDFSQFVLPEDYEELEKDSTEESTEEITQEDASAPTEENS